MNDEPKKVVIDPNLSLQTREMIEMYFAVKTVNGIEGFIYTEEELLQKFKSTYSLNDFSSAIYYAIFEVSQCSNCRKSFKIIVRNRYEFYHQITVENEYCECCILFKNSTERILGFNY